MARIRWFLLILAVLQVGGVAEAGRRFRRHFTGHWYRVDAYDGLWYARDSSGRFSALNPNSHTSLENYAGRDGLQRLAEKIADDAVWFEAFSKITETMPGMVGERLRRRARDEIGGTYDALASPLGLTSATYRSRTLFGTGYSPYHGIGSQNFERPVSPPLDPLTTIKELSTYAARLAEQSQQAGTRATEQGLTLIDGAIQGLVNAERIRAAGDVAVAAVTAAAEQGRSSEARFVYTEQAAARDTATRDSPASPGNWLEVIAARCVGCHSPQEAGGRGQQPFLDGEIDTALKEKILEAVARGDMPRSLDEQSRPERLPTDELVKLVCGIQNEIK